MTGREFALQCSSRDAHCGVGGVTTLKARIQSLSWFTGKTDVSAVANVRKTVKKERCRYSLIVYL
jgi:hypothetical protein